MSIEGLVMCRRANDDFDTLRVNASMSNGTEQDDTYGNKPVEEHDLWDRCLISRAPCGEHHSPPEVSVSHGLLLCLRWSSAKYPFSRWEQLKPVTTRKSRSDYSYNRVRSF